MQIEELSNKIKKALALSLEEISGKVPPQKIFSSDCIELQIPKDAKHGDLTTNVAMRLSGAFSSKPLALAEHIKDALSRHFKDGVLAGAIDRIEILPPGFINFWFKKEFLYLTLAQISKDKKSFGKNIFGKGKKVNIEFVSANPTGPLTIAHGRQAAVGDALSRIMAFSGFHVTKEYFINDVGNQISLLGKSIRARYLSLIGKEADFPQDGYQGDYIKTIAEDLFNRHGSRFSDETYKNLKYISEFGVETILEGIKKDLLRFGVHFDKWFSQKSISSEKIKKVLDALKTKGFVYEKEGAVWFKSTALGDDKDRVVIKSDGSFTYLAPDIAYHLNKYQRKFDSLIDIWGPDHHGYIPRLKASVEALGYDRESISLLIVQLATLFRDGAALSMSTRKGEFITLKEIMDEVGCDVAKFFFLMRKLDSHLDFDLTLAKKKSHDNPVFYIQYAHARIASIFEFSKESPNIHAESRYKPDLLESAEEILILRLLLQFPLVTEASAKSMEPYRVVEYLNDLAKAFHSFYTKHRVVSADSLLLSKARLALVGAVKAVLANGLNLLGISLPERM
ncbi:MAG: arginine--tRNA ligase [Candidatus Omnitrophota bacterium]